MAEEKEYTKEQIEFLKSLCLSEDNGLSQFDKSTIKENARRISRIIGGDNMERYHFSKISGNKDFHIDLVKSIIVKVINEHAEM